MQDPDNLLTGEAQGYAAAQIFYDVFKVRLSCSSVMMYNCLSRLAGEECPLSAVSCGSSYVPVAIEAAEAERKASFCRGDLATVLAALCCWPFH